MYYDIDNQELVSQLYNLLDIDNVVFKVDQYMMKILKETHEKG